jgi:hypothetical protein
MGDNVVMSMRITSMGQQLEGAIVEQAHEFVGAIKEATAQLATPEAITAMVAKEVEPIMRNVVKDCIWKYFHSEAGEAFVNEVIHKVVTNNNTQLESTIRDTITTELREKVTYELKFGSASEKVAHLITNNISNLLNTAS